MKTNFTTTADEESETMTKANKYEGSISALEQYSGEATDETFYNMSVLEDVGHPLVPSLGHTYYDQTIKGDVSLLEVLTHSLQDSEFSTLLEGESGSGKNSAIDYACSQTNWPRVRVPFGVNITYDEIVGHYSPSERSTNRTIDDMGDMMNALDDDVDAGDVLQAVAMGNGFEWQYGILAMAAKYGWVFVGDEINAAGGEVTTPLHGVTDDANKSELVIRETGEVISPHENFRFVGTINPTTYAGTKEMNQAFKNRFYCIPVDYMDSENEIQLLQDTTGITEEEATELVNFASDIRFKLGEEIMSPISPRDLMKCSKLYMNTSLTLNQAAHTTIVSQGKPSDKDNIGKQIDMHISN